MDILKKEIIESINNGNFLDLVYEKEIELRKKDSKLGTILIDLHNEDLIDTVTEFIKLKEFETNPNFFMIRQIFVDILPNINTSVLELKDCVKILTLKAGNDLNSHSLINPFINFCEKDITRVDKLLGEELENIDEEFDHISTALIAGFKKDQASYLQKAIDLLKHDNLTVVQRVIFAISRFDFLDDIGSVNKIYEEILSAHKETSNEMLIATKIRTFIILTAKYPETENNLLHFLNSQNQNDNPSFIFNIASQLQFNQKELSRTIQWKLFQFFKNINLEHQGIYQEIDSFLYSKIDVNESYKSIASFLDYLILNNAGFELKFIQNSINKLQNSHSSLILRGIITHWFLKKDLKFCSFTSIVLSTGTTDQIEIGYDTSQIELSDVVYLINKAIGWFVFQPLTALNLIISITPLIEDEQENEVAQNVFRNIAINYPGQTKDFFEKFTESENLKIKNLSNTILKLLDEYHNDLKQLFDIRELKPTIKQRVAYKNFHREMMEDTFDELDDSSRFISLVTKKVTLYGNKSIMQQKDFNGNEIRQVIPFNSFSINVELPKLENLTPHILQYKLIQFKSEGLTS